MWVKIERDLSKNEHKTNETRKPKEKILLESLTVNEIYSTEPTYSIFTFVSKILTSRRSITEINTSQWVYWYLDKRKRKTKTISFSPNTEDSKFVDEMRLPKSFKAAITYVFMNYRNSVDSGCSSIYMTKHREKH